VFLAVCTVYEVCAGRRLTAEGRRRREQVRLAAVGKFEQRAPVPEIAAELRVSERSVQRWRRAWEAGGAPGLASKGQAARSRLSGDQLAELDLVLDAGPAAAGWTGQRWTLARELRAFTRAQPWPLSFAPQR
jgi:transposase